MKKTLVYFLSFAVIIGLVAGSVLLSGCTTERIDPSEITELLEETEQLPEYPEVKGFSIEEKMNRLLSYWNQKWSGYVWVTGSYSFDRQLTFTDTAYYTVALFPAIPESDKQKGEPPDPEVILNEIATTHAKEIQTTHTKIFAVDFDGSIDVDVFWKAGQWLRKAQNWRDWVTQHFPGHILYPTEGNYVLLQAAGLPDDQRLKEQIGGWNRQWAGEAVISGRAGEYIEGWYETIEYFVRLGFPVPRAGFMEVPAYEKKINEILGEIVHTTAQDFPSKSFKMAVIFPDGKNIVFYSKVGALEEMREDISQEGESLSSLRGWTTYMVAKPFVFVTMPESVEE